MSKITIYDTTLRDGTQGLEISFSVLDKLMIARKLDNFGVDYIEGGWPGSNPKDIEFFEKAKKEKWKNAKITAFGSTRRANIKAEDDQQLKLLLEAQTPTVTFFGKSWDIHVEQVLKTTLDENLNMIKDTCNFFKKNDREVIYDAEHFFDGFKNNKKYAIETIKAAQDGGADIIILCDTNGGTLPEEITNICHTVNKFLKIPFGIHSHNDCELGVANAIAAINSGGMQIQGTINGIGERIGNCNLTSIIPILELKMNLKTTLNIKELTQLSKYIDSVANIRHNIRSAFVGKAAFAHKGGIHVDAVNKIRHSYEHIDPKDVGNSQYIVVSELSGQSNILSKANELGLDLKKGDPILKKVLQELKKLESQGYEFEAANASFILLVNRFLKKYKPFFKLLDYHCSYRKIGTNFENCEATVKIKINDKIAYTVEDGDGPVNALDKALRKALTPDYPQLKNMTLIDYKVRIINSKKATAAKTRVLITSKDNKIKKPNNRNTWGTVGVSDNIIHASWLAMVDSFEYFLYNNNNID